VVTYVLGCSVDLNRGSELPKEAPTLELFAEYALDDEVELRYENILLSPDKTEDPDDGRG
jgi:hypothetical protein